MVELILVRSGRDIYIENVQCNGNESHLEECPSSDVGVHDCSHSEDAGVSCKGICYDLGVILGPLRFHLQLYKSVTNIEY